MKRPDTIKASLKNCANENIHSECPYNGKDCIERLMKDALEYIEGLEGAIARVLALAKKLDDDLK